MADAPCSSIASARSIILRDLASSPGRKNLDMTRLGLGSMRIGMRFIGMGLFFIGKTHYDGVNKVSRPQTRLVVCEQEEKTSVGDGGLSSSNDY